MKKFRVPPSFAARDVTEWILAEERKAFNELHAGIITEDGMDKAGSAAKCAVRVSQKARKAPHTRGRLDINALNEAERVSLAMLATLKLIAQSGTVTDNNRAVIDIFEEWNKTLNYEVPRAVWLAAYGKPRRR